MAMNLNATAPHDISVSSVGLTSCCSDTGAFSTSAFCSLRSSFDSSTVAELKINVFLRSKVILLATIFIV